MDPSTELSLGKSLISQTSSTSKDLSCVRCRQRKVKCDKIQPCATCKRSRHECVYIKRASRARRKQYSARRESELLNRLGRLEAMLGQKSGSIEITDEDSRPSPDDQESQQNGSAPPSISTFISQGARQSGGENALSQVRAKSVGRRSIGGGFFATLGAEIEGLKQLLENASDEGEDEDEEGNTPLSIQSSSFFSEGFLFKSAQAETQQPDYHLSQIMFTRYWINVDPLFKILHRPTVVASIAAALDGSRQGIEIEVSLQALMASMYFCAVTSMTDQQCFEELGERREVLLVRFRRLAEASLSNSDFLNSTNLQSLQAFVLYLMCLRLHENNQAGWALFSLAARLAHALGMHRDGDGSSLPTFEAEMRRRLWWQIVALDVRAAGDRGTDPILLYNTYNTQLSTNINDADFGPDKKEQLVSRKGFTENTFCMMSQKSASIMADLSYVPPQKAGAPECKVDLNHMEVVVKDYNNYIESQFLSNLDQSIPIQWTASIHGRIMALRLWLFIRFPLRPRQATELPKDNIFKSVIVCMELAELFETHPFSANYRWHIMAYVQWHPLAVCLAELCFREEGELIDRAWAIIDKVFDKWSYRIADTKRGALWKPIKKLYKKAMAVRNSRLNNSQRHVGQAISDQETNSPLNKERAPDSFMIRDPHILDTITQDSIFGLAAPIAWEDPIGMDISTAAWLGQVDWNNWNEFIAVSGEPAELQDSFMWPLPEIPAGFQQGPVDGMGFDFDT